MRNNKKIFLVLLIMILLLTGCSKQLKDADGKVIKSEKTNQVLIENILCKPVELKDEYIKVINQKKIDYKKQYKAGDLSKNKYKKNIKNLLDIEKLPNCKKISPVEGGYETFWTSVFVKPLAWLIVNVGKILKNNYGLAIIVVTILIKLILLPFSYKSLKQSENMKKAQPKLSKLEKKYENKKDQESMMMKSNEMMAIYKEYKINPISGCLLAFIQIPLFFAFYEALYRLPILFEGKFLLFHMGTTPLAGAQSGDWYYLILPLIVGVVTYFSFNMNKNTMSEDQAKQMKMMFNIMIVMIFITSFSMSTAIIIYWVVNSLFTILQSLLIKRSK
ncbi:MAG: YidC/Oxa1 family membrane protein insertase [bacterium]|nr:YidC/Oxa1 family membrane protein insertase [bacterium]